ncbi:hypothetical protein GZ77_05950 [Endozoicomonas montiporae]|uniref:NAD/FAD-utilizing enzyme n=2 Tax=Endozoicomonas montiporae TaxID=1027273 RepID=A0A081NC39_9GAMM|nr:hypothetical protein [Endozoicomonas montiporae]AMO56336.1 hypothetical protein EZMO1_2235 [Endozoicomonas montiporae CL-33]KEQ16012.1 hypothetical protein GZ77_05950 [Endozoicomonas montiporae]
MKQHHYLLEDLRSAENAVITLENAGVQPKQIHVFHHDHLAMQKRHLNDASFISELDILHAGERGLLVGLFAAGLVAFVVWELLAGHEVVAMISVFAGLVAMGFCTWLGGMIGASSDNYRIQPYHDHIQSGGSVIIVDVDPGKELFVLDTMQTMHPEAMHKGLSSSIDNPMAGDFFLRKHAEW